MIKYSIILTCIFYSSCYVSAFNRPGVQIATKGVLRNISDTLKILPIISFSRSFEDNVHWKRFGVKHDVEKKDSSKLSDFLIEYLNNKKAHFDFMSFDTSIFILLDKVIYNHNAGNEFLPDSINTIFAKQKQNKILIMRFNFNVEEHLGYSTLGPAGQTYLSYEITSHALLIENLKVLYLRSNLAALSYVEDFFYKRAISRVLDDAFKK